MLFAALRDVQWRKRRLVIAIVSTGLVFAMTLVLTGLVNGFRVEAERTVDSMGVDAFVVKAGRQDRSWVRHHSPKSTCPRLLVRLASWLPPH